MTTTAPLADGRVIGLAHYAGRAVLESVLDRYGVTFQQSVTLRAVAVSGTGPADRTRLAGEVSDALKIPRAEADGVIDELIAAELLVPHEPSAVRITDAGREVYERSSAETGAISARIYSGIPAEDLAVAGRVLTLVTERADAELAAATGAVA
ncbi:MarR family winged helix-turn-helix transcriptional regulator [Streptomyces sp. Tu 3180]|uniref:MarR family winged helix-turn-helix transcriptional regulator n=1 Tax=Streptomyces sp. Tu 3180 TaxID=2682611 RepID=UPI0013595FE8|nr:MarR family winged helix-turn-helix transcriptional regulator [Streptomyces sp. Tu 3180]KAF3468900.1 winged helix-turn-helix transcriptional regulator [Streptomyces sp. Tu 3180]